MSDSTFIQRRPLFMATAAGIPKGQPRPRAFVRNGRAAVYDAGTAEGWKGDVARACAKLEGRCLSQCLAVSLTFYMPRPKAHYGKAGALKATAPRLIHKGKPDVDNLAKAVLDALTGIRAWLDDAQVAELTVRRHYEQHGLPPGCVIRIIEMTEVEL